MYRSPVRAPIPAQKWPLRVKQRVVLQIVDQARDGAQKHLLLKDMSEFDPGGTDRGVEGGGVNDLDEGRVVS